MSKSFLTFFLSLALIFNGPVARADVKDDANRLVNESHEMARRVAEDLFRFYLLSGVMENFNQGDSLKRITSSMLQIQADLHKHSELLQRSFLSAASAEDLFEGEGETSAQFNAHLDDAVKAYDDALFEIRRNGYLMNAGETTALATQQKFGEILSHLEKSCRVGATAQFLMPNLPPVTIRPPGFSVGFQFQANFDGSSFDADMSVSPTFSPTMSQYWGEDSGAYVAAGFSLTQLGFMFALDKPGFLASVSAGSGGTGAASGSSAGLASSTVAWATVYAIVVWVAVMIVTDILAREKAKDQADAVENAVRGRATSDSVAAYYRDLCQTLGKPLLDVRDEWETLKTAPASSPVRQKFERDAQQVNEQTSRMMKLSEDLETLKQKLIKQGLSGQALDRAVSESAANKALTDFALKEIGIAGLVKIVRVQLLNLSFGSTAALVTIRDLKKNRSTEQKANDIVQQLKDQRARLSRLYRISYQQSLERQVPGSLEALRQEIKSDKEFSRLYRKWQKLYMQYLVAVFNGESTHSIAGPFRALYQEAMTANQVRPSEALDLLLRRLAAFQTGAR